MLQTLSNQRFPPTHIAQLSGHNNINSIENYRSLSKQQQQQQQQQQQSMSNMLANISSEKAVSLPKVTANNPLPLKIRTLAQPRESSSVTEQQSVGIFLVKQLSRADSSQLQLTPKIAPPENRLWKGRHVLKAEATKRKHTFYASRRQLF